MNSIVKALPETPKEGTIVHARGRADIFRDPAKSRVERCVYKDGKFMAGGDQPIPVFELLDVDRWAYQADLFSVLGSPLNGDQIDKLMAGGSP